jgi:hypothetical protein
VKNIQKCLNAGYSTVCVVSKDEKHLRNIQEKVVNEIENQDNIRFFNLDQIIEFLDSLSVEEKPVERIRGYRVRVNYVATETSKLEDKKTRSCG